MLLFSSWAKESLLRTAVFLIPKMNLQLVPSVLNYFFKIFLEGVRGGWGGRREIRREVEREDLERRGSFIK